MQSRPERPARPATSSRLRRARLALVLPLTLLLSACASYAPQDTLRPKGPFARSIDNLWDGVFAIAVVVFFFVQLGTLFIVVRFRRRKGDDELPTQTHGNPRLEIAWTLLPAVILAVVGFFTLRTLFDIKDVDEDDLTIRVVGQQWWWEYQYDTNGDGTFGEGDVVTANDLVIPAGVDVHLEVTSNDVIHSFWIPSLNGKMDAVPGRVHPLLINADEPGTYVGQCTESCGLSHAYMRQRVIALPMDERGLARGAAEDAEMPDPTRTRGVRRRRAVHHAVLGCYSPGASTTRSSRRATASCWSPGTPRPDPFASRGTPAGATSTCGSTPTATRSSKPTRSARAELPSSRPGSATRPSRSRYRGPHARGRRRPGPRHAELQPARGPDRPAGAFRPPWTRGTDMAIVESPTAPLELPWH